MSDLPERPLMLQPDRLEQLNKHLVETTGCFAFLKTDQVLFSPRPQQWQDAYTIFSVGLYAVYHDYGCKFLYSILLSDDFCPNTLPEPRRHRSHIDMLNRHIRTNLAHGLLNSFQREELQRKLFDYYLRDPSRARDPWPEPINGLTEKEWMTITKKLIEDSNDLYYFLWSWGDEWAKNPESLPELRERFATYENCFADSVDGRICCPLLHSYGIKHSDISQYTNGKKQSAPINQWRQHLIEAYRKGMWHPEELYRELEKCIKEEVEPAKGSSIDIAAEFGF